MALQRFKAIVTFRRTQPDDSSACGCHNRSDYPGHDDDCERFVGTQTLELKAEPDEAHDIAFLRVDSPDRVVTGVELFDLAEVA